jgi:nucleoid-associated protein YgaU
VKSRPLRAGQKLVLPPKPEEKIAAAPEEKPAPEPAPPAARPRDYTVQQGDTLSDISKKVYGTARHYEKIFEANRDKIDDPNTLVVGRKLVLPDLAAAPAGGTVQTSAAPVPPGARVHQIQQGDSLWKIAEKYAGEKGVLETLKAIVGANADKFKDGERTLLRLGWQIVVPE